MTASATPPTYPVPDEEVPRTAPRGAPGRAFQERYVSPGLGEAATVRLPRADAYVDHKGYWEQIAFELAAWIESTAQAVAAEMYEGEYAPFSARITAERQAAYYADRLFFPGGLPNGQAWQQLYQTAGAQGLVDAVKAAERWREAQGLPVYVPPPVEPGVARGSPPPGGAAAAPMLPPPGATTPTGAPFGPPPGPAAPGSGPGGLAGPMAPPTPYTPSVSPPPAPGVPVPPPPVLTPGA